ncbi:hypothetical protein [Candidatus Nitrosocosmicus franklandus]|uniref:Uncharacterized protein n=1 Tax=Candidatus Nitrosocosmicus franklandianus TaxID=1798806 RepID=A0A484ICK9_9ARCH|nr:hypothetical protein [Candidatus Nitrosocosmicus franklandus]VFJ14465.1 protein of unknown function [Candidatus Nitrosocosmicus franklandus]
MIQELPITRSLFDESLRNKKSSSIATLSEHALAIYKQMEDNNKNTMQEKIDGIGSIDELILSV